MRPLLLTIFQPLSNPVAIFMIVLLIILLAPILLKRLRIPHIVGMILAGLLVGPHGLNILPRDSSIELFGQLGLLYIMFLAGVEIDLNDLRKNRYKSLVFGLFTFLIPLLLGYVSSRYLLHYALASSVLMAAMYASHTLVSFPMLSRLGLAKKTVVNIAVGGTIVTETLVLLILAAVSSHYRQEADSMNELRMLIGLLVSVFILFFIYPPLTRWFLKTFRDSVLQFVFILVLAFGAALLTEYAGMHGVLGIFFAGLVLNKYIPKVSPLMNRLEFMGNMLFIPYFLISIGMMINFSVFAHGTEALYVALLMIVVALLGKWLASVLARQTFKMSRSEGLMLFGLSSGRAAVTLAILMIGYNIVLGYDAQCEPLRLLNEYVLNGSLVVILVSCIVSAVATDRAARRILLDEAKENPRLDEVDESLLIPIANPKNIDCLVQLALLMRGPRDKLYALRVVDDIIKENNKENSLRQLIYASKLAAAADLRLQQVLRYDSDVANGIIHTVREYNISDVILGLHQKLPLNDFFLGAKTRSLMTQMQRGIYISRFILRPADINRILLVVPVKAEFEKGFLSWFNRMINLASNLNAGIDFYATAATINHCRQLMSVQQISIRTKWIEFNDLNNLPELAAEIKADDLLTVVLSRQGSVSYKFSFENIAQVLEKNFNDCNLILVYPNQTVYEDSWTSFYSPLDFYNEAEELLSAPHNEGLQESSKLSDSNRLEDPDPHTRKL
ncbi:MAG: cation:proton antiporter [Bacteroidales bacterium]|nr:cation:proton antiporter [Bacteroidales bacterium]MDD4641280.1 cation:proton antiporter [Bacteroidales bacterium]